MNFMLLVQKKWVRRSLWAVGSLLVVWALAWAALPALLKSQAESRGSEALGRKVTIGAIDFKPWTLELAVSDIQVATQDGASSQLSIARIYVDAEMQSALRLAPVLDAVTVDTPVIHLTHLGDGRYDIDDVLERLKPKPDAPASAPVRFALYNLLLNNGSLDFVDRAGGKERTHVLRNLHVAAPFLSNLESQRDINVQPRLAFELNGSAFDSAAQATPFAASRKGEATVQITHFDIAPYLPYLPPGLAVQLKSGVLDTRLKLSFAQADKPSLSLSGDIKVSGIRLADAKGGGLLSVASVEAVLKDVRPLERRVQLDSLDIKSVQLQVARNAAGQLNLAAAPANATAPKPAPAAQGAANAAATPAPEWQVELARLGLADGTVNWNDAAVPGSARLSLTNTDITVKNIRWPFPAPTAGTSADLSAMQFEGSAALQADKSDKADKAAKPARLSFKGEGTDRAGTASANLSGMGLKLLAPYLGQYLVPRADGVVGVDAKATWKDGAVQWALPRVAVEKFALSPAPGAAAAASLPATPGANPAREYPAFALLEVLDTQLDLAARTVAVGKVALRSATVRVQREQDGQWMFKRWLKAPDTPAESAVAAPWKVAVADIALDDSTVSLVDRVPVKRVFVELSAIKLHALAFSPDGKKPMPLTVSAKLRSGRGDPGALKFDGNIMWDPLAVQGAVEVTQVPLHVAAPYFADRFNVELLRADANFKGQVGYAQLPDGPTLRVQGDAAIDDLVANSVLAVQKGSSEPTTEELLNWKILMVPGVDLTLVPGTPLRLKVREVALSDFFARLIINAEGRLVLQDLVKSEGAATTAAPPPPPPPAGAASAPAALAVAQAPKASTSPFIEIGPISIINGRVAFSDRFIKPNYSADLSELNGKLSRFSSQTPDGSVQMADLELRGRAEGTAGLEVVGKVNPLAKPLALDVVGKVRDLELSPLSSYAIKYAGYGIERGKLSVDVNYVIQPDGNLTATNKIILSQLTFGEKLEGTSSLPVKLAVALLSDRNGVIDLDLPISGSLNDPQFRIWPIVWKIVGNLITKALTSPFSLFSGGGGGGGSEELGNVAFDVGTSNISASALAGLDKVAQAMVDKPALRMTITGAASLEQERNAIQRDRLNAMLLLEKRRIAGEAGQDVSAVSAVSEAEYASLLKEVYRRSDVKKPRNFIGLRKDLPVPDMEALLLASITVNEDTVRELARRRSVVVRDYLTARKLPSTRLFLGADKMIGADAQWKPQVELSLSNN